MNKNFKPYFAESIGTFALVFAGTGAIIINDVMEGSISQVGIGLSFGLVVMVMVYALGEVSGAHINPAVTLGFCVLRKFPSKKTASYIVFQTAGAVSASLILRLLFPTHRDLGLTLPTGSVFQSFALEFLLTFLLMFVILQCAVRVKGRSFSGSAIGATVGLGALFAGPICGASMNPARSFAPALISGNFTHLWVYILAPVSGAILGALINMILIRA
jgi:aquaporin Z